MSSPTAAWRLTTIVTYLGLARSRECILPFIYIHLRLFVYIRVSVGVGWFPFPAFPVHKGVSRVGLCVRMCASVWLCVCVCVRESVLISLSLPSVASGVFLGCPRNSEARLPTLHHSLVQDPRGPAFLHART